MLASKEGRQMGYLVRHIWTNERTVLHQVTLHALIWDTVAPRSAQDRDGDRAEGETRENGIASG